MNIATLDKRLTALSGGRWAFPPVVPAAPDDEALAFFETQLGALGELWHAVDGADEELCARAGELEWAIARTPAAGVRGVAVKLHRLRVSLEDGPAAWDGMLERTLREGMAQVTRMKGWAPGLQAVMAVQDGEMKWAS